MGRWLSLLALAAVLAGAMLLRGTSVEPLASPTPGSTTLPESPESSAVLHAPPPAERRAAPSAATTAEEPAQPAGTYGAPPLLVGRLVLADGTPYADQTPQLSITRGNGARVRSQPDRTDAEGRFEYSLANVEPPLEGLRLTARERSLQGRILAATVDLPLLRRGETTDLGDVVLRLRAVGVSCRLVDRDGRPVTAEGELGPEVELWGPEGLVRHHHRGEHGSGVVLQFGGGVESGWLALDPRGSSIFPKPWFVDPRQPGAKSRAVGGRAGLAVRAGDDVELVVAHGGTIRGSVLRDAGPFAEVTQLRVRAMEDVEPLSWGREADEQVVYGGIEEDGRFEIEGVDAGLRRVEFLSGQVALVTIENVEVRLELVVEDPRLQGVDLGVLARTLTLRVVDTGGALVPEAAATLARSGSYEGFQRTDDVVLVLIPEPSTVLPAESDIDLVVHAPGFVPVKLTPPFQNGTVVLEPAIPIRARTAKLFESDIGSHGFWLRLRRVDGPSVAGWLWATELPFGWDGNEPAEITAPGPGRYELEVMVKMRMGTLIGTSPSDRFVGTGVFLEVGPENAASPLVVDVPEDLLQFDT